ncbi:MAG: RNA polymerase sigma factor FliA [Porticoccus sp.]|nr:RNA polymerase sigma factor FliA [Porticoccus sp.]|tara:strand:- start:736 stop:1440 length:705 start_codon:yes stop_codon:yes gene_type:complete
MNEASVYAQSQRDGRDNLVEDYLPLVKKIGLHLVAKLPKTVELDDLLQVGMIGLIQARESYDASQGAGFATYAGIRIKGAMLDEVRRNDWVPRSVQQKMKQVGDAIRCVEARLSRPASAMEIAEELNIPLIEYQVIASELACCRMSSLDELEAESESEGEDPFAQLEGDGFKQALAGAIQMLPQKEQLMMSLYYSDELNLKEIGEILGVSESRVSQLHGQALARVRVHMSSWVC